MNRAKLLSTLIVSSILTMQISPALCFPLINIKKKTQPTEVISGQIAEYKLAYINIDWWESFNDNLLKGYIMKALEQNQDLKIATLKVEEFNHLARMQFAKELPGASISPGLGSFKMAGTSSSSGRFNLPIIMSYEADIFQKNKYKTKSARKQIEVSKYDEKATYIAITSAVSSTYLNLVKVDELIRIQEELISYKEQIYDLMLKRNKHGLTSTSDVVKANKELVIAQTDLIELEKARNILCNKLAVLTGESPQNSEQLKRISYNDLNFDTKIPTEIPSEVITKRPDVLKAEKNLEKAGIDVKVARKEFLPSINILGLAVFASSSLTNSIDWNNALSIFGGQADFTLFSGGYKTANLKLKKNVYEQMLQNYHKTNLVAIQEVNDSLSTLKLDAEKYNQNIEKLKMENAELQYNQKRYSQGVISYLDLIQRKENLLSINKTVASSKTDCLIDFISLYKATGSQL